MSAIHDITEAWAGHSGLEVETWLKGELAKIGTKFGNAQFTGSDLVFYDQENGQVLQTLSLTGDIFTISVVCNLPQSFYVLADETSKVMTFTPSTVQGHIGSSETIPFPETYHYQIAINSGSGYVVRADGDTTQTGQTISFDIINYLSNGDNFIRLTVEGHSSGQVRSIIYTAVKTSLTMSVNHPWQNAWMDGEDYSITGIRFAGSLEKTLHVRLKWGLNSVELDPVAYGPQVQYITTSTYYTIPASAFPATNASGVCTVELWMTAQGVSTPVTSYNIMCVKSGDTTPLVAINAITPSAVNYTSDTLFSFAIYNANRARVSLSAELGGTIYIVGTNIPQANLEVGVQYPFAYALEVDTGANEVKIGTFSISVTALMDETSGFTATGSTVFDNTYSYIATEGALFYLNASTRDNARADFQTIINEMGASQDGRFAASYTATWNGMAWRNDGWATDSDGYKALVIPAGCSCVFNNFRPLSFFNSYPGMTIEMMIQSGHPSDYDTPIFQLLSADASDRPLGIVVYPTKITVWGNGERDEDYQSINISENRITHICAAFTKRYEGESTKNICAVYINGTANISFSFGTSPNFGDGEFTIGQPDTDAYLYKMRVYGTALEPEAVYNNFLNCVIDGVEFVRADVVAKNNILDGQYVDYDKVKAAGLNTMVITTPNDVPVPNFYNQVTVDHTNVRFEYAGSPQKNVTVTDVSMDGQGTTSKKYYRWNLRWKTSDNTQWSYGDGTTAQGKTGKVINDDSYVAVDRITAKKNIASSPQGHKMGLTGLYNDLFHEIGSVVAGLPVSSYRVAVYQFPFMGFQYNASNNTYTFLGLYTAGPDKGSKVTFGYIKGTYPNCLSIEGPNHSPRGTRFMHPWVDVTYSPSEETLMFGGVEGWDCDYVKWETSTKGTQADWDNILNLYEASWKPAYNCVYDNSPYIASVEEVIADLDDPSITTKTQLLAPENAETVRAGVTNSMIVPNANIAIYDKTDGYKLYFYRELTGQYEALPNDYSGYKTAIEGLSTYLTQIGAVNPSQPTTAEIISARGARFRATAPDYFDMQQTLFHYVFCILYGVTDNFAKNSYPQIYRLLTDEGAGNRWGWRQDDLDSVLATDNNGTNTKKYSVEHLDTADNTQIFQGGESALWVLIHDYYENEQRTMMGLIAQAASRLATAYGIAGSGLHASLFNLTSYYCWEHSAKYFPITAYEKDRRYSYIDPWLIAGTPNPAGGLYPERYNGVLPLTQAVGDQYQGERLWVERRIAYIFSKYRIGAFTADGTGYGEINFTLASAFQFTITPAIDLYPVLSLADGQDFQGGRTTAGTPVNITMQSEAGTNNYIHGGDWLASLGPLHGMRLTTRGTSTAIGFSVTAVRLQNLQIGHPSDTILFNATNLGVTSPTITEIDARRVTTITNVVDLLGCPRLRRVLFAGCTQSAGLLLPVGARVTEVSFPDNSDTVFMHSLEFLQPSGLTLPAAVGISTLYINGCTNLDAFGIVETILDTANNHLAYVTLIWKGIKSGKMDTLLALMSIGGYVSFENNTPGIEDGVPYIEGTVSLNGLHEGDLEEIGVVSDEPYGENLRRALTNYFNSNLYIIYNPNNIYISFVDPVVEQICVTNWSTDGVGVTTGDAAAVTTLNGAFQGNATITLFNELRYFTSLTTMATSTNTQGQFYNCTSLRSAVIPAIGQWTSGDGNYTLWRGAFNGCSALEEITFIGAINRYSTRLLGNGAEYLFVGCTNLTRANIPSLELWLQNNWAVFSAAFMFGPFDASGEGHLYLNGVEVKDVVIPNTVTELYSGVFRFVRITSVTIPNSVTKIGREVFRGCPALTTVNFPSSGLTEIGNYAFYDCTGLTGTLTIPSSVTSIGASAFNGCTQITSLIINTSSVAPNVFNGVGSSTNYCDVTINGSITGAGVNATTYIGRLTVSGNVSTNLGSYWNVKQIRIGGNLTWAGGGNGFVFPVTATVFLEIMGDVTCTNKIINSIKAVHLGYNGVITALPGLFNLASNGMFYVGDGSSAAHDDAILAQYTADSNWSAYASKLDTWYNYDGEYKD